MIKCGWLQNQLESKFIFITPALDVSALLTNQNRTNRIFLAQINTRSVYSINLTNIFLSISHKAQSIFTTHSTRLILNCNTLSAFDHEFLLRKGYLTFLYPWRYFPNGFEPKDLVVNFLISRGKLTLLFPFRVLVFPHISSNSPDVISAFPLKFELLELFEGFQIFPLFQDYCLILYLRGRYYFTIGSW